MISAVMQPIHISKVRDVTPSECQWLYLNIAEVTVEAGRRLASMDCCSAHDLVVLTLPCSAKTSRGAASSGSTSPEPPVSVRQTAALCLQRYVAKLAAALPAPLSRPLSRCSHHHVCIPGGAQGPTALHRSGVSVPSTPEQVCRRGGCLMAWRTCSVHLLPNLPPGLPPAATPCRYGSADQSTCSRHLQCNVSVHTRVLSLLWQWRPWAPCHAVSGRQGPEGVCWGRGGGGWRRREGRGRQGHTCSCKAS